MQTAMAQSDKKKLKSRDKLSSIDEKAGLRAKRTSKLVTNITKELLESIFPCFWEVIAPSVPLVVWYGISAKYDGNSLSETLLKHLT